MSWLDERSLQSNQEAYGWDMMLGELFEKLEKEFGKKFAMLLPQPDRHYVHEDFAEELEEAGAIRNKQPLHCFGWIEHPTHIPDADYVKKATKLVEILAENYKRNFPKGFFTLDNNLGDMATSFKIYIENVD